MSAPTAGQRVAVLIEAVGEWIASGEHDLPAVLQDLPEHDRRALLAAGRDLAETIRARTRPAEAVPGMGLASSSTQEQRLLADWTRKARLVRSLRHGERWPAWSTGEVLAVALILHDDEQLAAMDYTRAEALERLRHDIGQPTRAAAQAVFEQLRAAL